MSQPVSAVQDGADYAVKDEADFVIVGSGATGATMARWLTAAGRSVIVVEEGPPAVPATGDGREALALYRDAGTTRVHSDNRLSLLQGRVVGGSNYLSGAVHIPLPEQTWTRWAAADPAWKARMPWEALHSAHERMDRELAVQKTPRHLWTEDADALLRALPGEAAATWRATPGCRGSGRCHQGCPHAGKAGANLTLLPLAMQRGARVYARCGIRRVDVSGTRAVGVTGQFENGHPFVARASRGVILAAGATQTPALLRRSGVTNAGEGWSCHPVVTLAAQWHKPLTGEGATRSVEAFGDRFAMETQQFPRTWRRLFLPDVGAPLAAHLDALDQVVTWSTRITPTARGSVRADGVHFSLTPADRVLLARGVARTIEAMLRSGALCVWPQIEGWPESVASLRQVADLATRPLEPRAAKLTATHLFGGVQTDARGQVPGVDRLIVADASALPGPTGVPPLSVLFAMATVLGQTWADMPA